MKRVLIEDKMDNYYFFFLFQLCEKLFVARQIQNWKTEDKGEKELFEPGI